MRKFLDWLLGRKKKPAKVSKPSQVTDVAITHGVSVFSGWAARRPEFGPGGVPGAQCPAEYPWGEIKTSDRRMALGEYDERDPAITAQHIRWMQEGGIDFACIQIEWAHNQTQPDKLASWTRRFDPVLMSHVADNWPAASPVKFCVSLWDVMASANDPNYWKDMVERGWGLAEAENSWKMYANAVATRYMAKASYLTVEGRPVLFHGYAQALDFYLRTFGLTPEHLIRIIRDEVKAVTRKELYLVATCTEPSAFKRLRNQGFDAFTEYLLYSDSWKGALGIYRERWAEAIKVCEATGIEYWVPATAGYDSRAWGSPETSIFIPTPAEFTAHLKEARAFAAKHVRHTRGFVCTYAWNEIGEGGIIEPMAPGQLHDGDAMLRAHKAAA